MASTKTRRPAPQGVMMSTPPPQSRNNKSMYSEIEKQGLLANFDIEVADKTLFFRSILSRTLASFRMREESEILSIPRELRGMTLGELEDKWGGGWAGTLQKIRRESFEKKEKVREDIQEKEREEVVKGKRKRNGTTTADNSPERGGKNPRRDAPTPSSTRRAAPSSATRSKAPTSAAKKSKPAAPSSSSSSKGPSTLPQNHIFNPSLPPTPFFSNKSRPPTSPLSQPSMRNQFTSPSRTSASDSDDDSNHQSDDDDASGDSDELPDPELLEAQLLAKTPHSKSSSNSNKSKKKRGPSLIFRQSINPNAMPIPQVTQKDSDEPLSNVELSDGRIISFNPFSLTPGRVERELEEGGVSKEEQKKVQEKVHEEVVKNLRERMERWKV
ncbi:uncharacterized protein IL334_004669 [Kwoniella shivajii]|uniref:Borealin N-terminal domain-containing protein n=1 Tax=Kwoniella shivajii TaxID=564305 RepID=A0ABZ1D278_9TREE|nr:hypothetical protein IL334_004669 [Kwoniella shivajii]